MTQFTIPKSLDDAAASLGGIDQLLTAKEWERAAIVWAFTRDGQGQRPTSAETRGGRLTITDFAKLKITGLRDPETVRSYRRQWQRAMEEADAPDVKPGQKITVPDLEWSWGDVSTKHQRRFTERTALAFATSLERGDVDPDSLARELSPAIAERMVERFTRQVPHVVRPVVERVTVEQIEEEAYTRGTGGGANKLRHIADRLAPGPYERAVGALAACWNALRDVELELPGMTEDQQTITRDHLAAISNAFDLAARSKRVDIDAELAELLEEGGLA